MKNCFVVGFSLTGDNNEYDYSNTVSNNGYIGSKDSYLNSEHFYNDKDVDHKLSNHIGSYSLINGGNQGSTGSDMGTSYSKYTVNDHGGDYSGYSKTYENSNSDSYSLSNHAASIAFRGYPDFSNNAEANFNTYSGGSAHKDSDFGQYAAGSNSNSQKILPYAGYAKPIMLENYSENIANSEVRAQGYHGSTNAPSYSESDHVYSPYPPVGPVGEYPFGKQKDSLYGNLKDSSKYNDIRSMPTETRYTRENMGYSGQNRGTSSPYVSGSGYLSKMHGSGVYYSAGKPYKYGYKYMSRYAPNSGVTYLTRDSHYIPYGKSSGKVIIIKDNRPNYASVYSDERYIGAGGGYRNKNSGFISASGYSASPNFDGYSNTGSNYNEGPVIPRRYRASGGPMFLQKTIYS